MGCGFSNSVPEVKFENGMPTFKGDEVVRCFEQGNGLLFRIVNKKTGQWALYNDTLDSYLTAHIRFSPESEIKALGHTRIERLSGGEKLATLRVPPGETEMFIQGTVGTFTCEFSSAPLVPPAEKEETSPRSTRSSKKVARPAPPAARSDDDNQGAAAAPEEEEE